MKRPTCLARLALRRLFTLENFALALIVTGTAASVAMTACVGAIVLRLLP